MQTGMEITEQKFYNILWHIDLLLGNDCETNKTVAIARQQLCKYTTVLEPFLGSSPCATMEVLLEVVFSMALLQVELVQWSGASCLVSE
jgi:hypothetical protein